ncbi:MAG: 16S rRNA (guanine(966)-N(2))-methyltransferase RsmD [Hyphomicrobiales bacterium]|nr:MAG: 16S rRNA (guanine(966)-N(2))-methyltransferase RsmD [Hyphomicrobiales bacterium]
MRIVGGEFRGRTLLSPKSAATRPTSDRTRESLFNILVNRMDFADLRVLDLFAGTGALGIEALSRGADYCVFIENASSPYGVIRQNIESFNLHARTKLLKIDATNLGKNRGAGFDLIFLDPPYGKALGEKAVESLVENNWLNEGATLILEEATSSAPTILAGFTLEDQRKFGDTMIGIFKVIPA